jgi:Ni/Co efflux regulator RcnB
MPSASPKQQFQPPIQLKILKRVLKTVRAASSVAGDSADRKDGAARLKPKFQNGVNKEADPDDRGHGRQCQAERSRNQVRSVKGQRAGRWEDDGGSPAMHHAIKGPQPMRYRSTAD